MSERNSMKTKQKRETEWLTNWENGKKMEAKAMINTHDGDQTTVQVGKYRIRLGGDELILFFH